MRSLVVLAAFVLCAALVPRARQDSGSALDELAWLEGTWRIEREGEMIEECYGPVLGNSITGTFRWLRKDAAWVYEFLLIEQRGEEITYYLRHFGPGSVAHEAEDAPPAYALVDVRENEAVFENLENSPQRMTYTLESPERLTLTLETERDGEIARDVFAYEQP